MRTKWIGLLSFAMLAALTLRAGDMNEDLWEASRKGDLPAVKALLEKGANVNARFHCGTTALFQAAWKGHLEVVKVLLEHGADVSVKETCFHSDLLGWAAFKGRAEIVKLLLEKGAAGKEDALMNGIFFEDPEIVRAVLNKGGLSGESLSSALAAATQSKQAEIVELLKKAGATASVPSTFQVDIETLKSYAGIYENPEGTHWTLQLKDGKIVGGPTGDPPSVLEAIDKTNFRPAGDRGITLTFNLTDGKVSGLTLKMRRSTEMLKKQEGKP